MLAPYDSRYHSGRYVQINDRVLQKLLLDKRSRWDNRNRPPKDQNKITLSGLILYGCALFVLAANVVLQCLVPRIPAAPWEMNLEKLYVHVDTVNERLCVALIWFFFLAALAYMMIELIPYAKTAEATWARVVAYVFVVAMLIAIAFAGAELILVDGLLSF